jgi:hypothetical protein
MAPQRLEKIESGPGNGMGSEAADPQDVAHGRAADGCLLRLTSLEKAAERIWVWIPRNQLKFQRLLAGGLAENSLPGKLQKKAPNALKSLDAKLKSAPVLRNRTPRANSAPGSRAEIFLPIKP